MTLLLRFFTILGFAIGLSFQLTSQVPANPIGNNGFDLKWKQINTDKIRLIFPEGVDSSAQRAANIIHALWKQDDPSIGKSNIKASILFNSDAINSNGFVTVGPFRSEFFPSQRQFGNSTDYLDLLTIHEYRHIQQFANATKGITKLTKNILGSWAWGGMMALALPRWYFEGDAVHSETDATLSGRGRLPSFTMQYHALFNDKVNYSFEKAGAGSIRDYVPDWYPLGYTMLGYGREHFGDDLWVNVVDDAVRYKGLFYPFSRSLKKRTGLSSGDLYKASMSDLEDKYQKSIQKLTLTESSYPISDIKKVVTNYSSPRIFKSDLLYIKSSYDQLAAITLFDRDKESKITEIGRQLDAEFSNFSIGTNLITWAQLGFDKRWRYRQYGDIYTYDMLSKRKVRITEGKRYLASAINRRDNQIASIYISESLQPVLHILDARSGDFIQEYSIGQFTQISHPVWANDDKVVAVVTKGEHSAIGMIDMNSSEWSLLTPLTPDQLSFPFVYDDNVLFSSSYSGINNIYSVGINDPTIYQLTEVAVGAFHPMIDPEKGQLYYTELESKGMKLKSTAIEHLKNEKFTPQSTLTIDKHFHHDHHPNSILTNLPDSVFEIKKFNKLTGILNPHSVLPQFNHPEVSVSLLSDNVFNTLSGELGGIYNYNEDEWTYFVGFNYAELFPIINASYAHVNRSAQFFNFSNLTDTTTLFTAFPQRWSEDRLSLGLTFPFNLSSGNTNAGANIGVNFQTAQINLESNFDNGGNFRDTLPSVQAFTSVIDQPINNARVNTLDFRMNLFAFKRTARLQVRPRIGGSFALRFRKQLSNQLSGGDVFNLEGSLFMPGLHSTHSFYITADYQKENVLDTYRYSDQFDYPRGYDISFRRDGFFKLGFNYSFPFAYPDAALGPFAFVKRLKGNIFYDFGRISLSTDPFEAAENMNSVGLELGFDFRAFRLVEVDMGLRYSYLFDPQFSDNGDRHQFDFFVISITQ